MVAQSWDGLPLVDEHRIRTPAPADAVWRELARQVPGTQAGATLLARLLGTEPRRASGVLFDPGATLPGFAVTEAVPGRLIRLTGRHHYARYALLFTLTPEPEGTLVSASTYAAFPGPLGRLYRLAVIGTGSHRILVRRMLHAVRQRAAR